MRGARHIEFSTSHEVFRGLAISIAVCTVAFLCPTAAFTTEHVQSYSYQTESTMEITGKETKTTSRKVWFQKGSMRIEVSTPLTSPRIAFIYRDGQAFVLNLTDKIVTKEANLHPSTALAAAEQESKDLTNYVDVLTRQRAVKVASEDVAGQMTDVYEVPHPQEAMNGQVFSHKVWVSHALNIPVKEVAEGPKVKSTIIYKNVKLPKPVPDDLFAVPGYF